MFDIKTAQANLGQILAATLAGPGETEAQIREKALETEREHKAREAKRAKWRAQWKARQARVRERLAAGLPPSEPGRPTRAYMIAQWRSTGNPRPAFMDDDEDRLREMRYRSLVSRMVNRGARLTAGQPEVKPRKRRPVEVTRKERGSVRFERLNALLGVMESVPGSTAKQVKP